MRRPKHSVNYSPNAIFEVEEWILQHPNQQFPFFGSFPAPGPKPPKEAFLLAAQRLREGITKDEFMVGSNCRVCIVPLSETNIMIDIY